MIHPSECYNQHRSQSGIVSLGAGDETVQTIGGIASDPWRVISTVTNHFDFSRYVDAEMHDFVTPDFLRRRRRGEIINSPMERTVISNDRQSATVTRTMINRSSTAPYTFSGTKRFGNVAVGRSASGVQVFALPPEPSLPNLQSWINQTVTDMWAKVSVKQNDTIASVGEMRETVSSLISIFKRALEIFRALKKLRLDTVYRKTLSPKALAEYYMFYRYALRPLVFEAQSYVDVLCNSTILKRQTFRSYRTYSAPMQTYSNVTLFDSVGNFICKGSQIATRNVEIRGGVLCTLDITNNLGRWGITEPLEGVWELIPFSFIIDWFWNIGKHIAMWTPNFGIKTLASWYVVTDMTTLTSTVESGNNYGSFNYQNIFKLSGSYSKVIVRKWRIPDPTRPILPVWRVNLDWLKSLDIGIILKQLIAAKY